MNYADFMTGQAFANAANQRSEADAREAIGEWKDYCSQLTSRLAEAEKNLACGAAREAGRDAQQKALRDALARVAPDHPLLAELPEIAGRAMKESFAKSGYDYNPQTELLRKRG